ncbi:hypothetical protein ABH15_00135 [Methanoculleus taiwanensis]|uniref:Alpha/beta hydrolase n=1 Tax=Methanoculleus taiwanensis TaxID=1550565 RepID=A0A498H3Y7_9EURY|nr:hypothetical protein [Methanoculleus taiwanensis]RXE56636.1 hypothetical protein ABH15_00135 [Methanoculleus taiwanensis]
MENVVIDGITLEYEVTGSGEPALFIHGALIADSFRPLLSEPVLAVLGSESNALWERFGETHRLLLEWFPDVRVFILPGAAHGMQMQNVGGMAGALADFWVRHPVRPGA